VKLRAMMSSSDLWDEEAAARYDERAAEKFAPDVLDPTVEFLARLAGPGPVLEFAVGTGRVAIPLVARGIRVTGIDLSQPMLDELRRKIPEVQLPVVVVFRNAARHLARGGRFVIELWIPGIRRLPPGQTAVPFEVSDRHVGFDTYDMTTQQGTSHHYWRQDDETTSYSFSNFRYIWPAECDLMAQLAGLELEQRVADWDGSPFTSNSESHVSVWRKP
jgi:SAM-dependent methyltransferase